MLTLEEVKRQSLENDVPIIFEDTAFHLCKLVKKLKPKNILEIGGGTGYSATVMLNASPHSKLTSIEKDCNRFEILKQVINPHTAICGDAYCIMKDLIKTKAKFDFVFLDGPKAQYGKYFDLIEQLLEVNGTVFADNMNFHGMVNGKIETTSGARSIVRGLKDYIYKIKLNNYLTKNLDDGDGIIIYTKIDESKI